MSASERFSVRYRCLKIAVAKGAARSEAEAPQCNPPAELLKLLQPKPKR